VALFDATLGGFPPTYLFEDAGGWLVSDVDTGLSLLELNGTHDFVVGDEVIVGGLDTASLPSPLVSDTVYYVSAAAGTDVALEATLGGGTIPLTDVGSGTFWVAHAPDPAEPLGGNLLEDEDDVGNDEIGGGPWPIYLGDGVAFFSVEAALARHLPSGVHLRIGFNPLV
jgi:hypothetical protein